MNFILEHLGNWLIISLIALLTVFSDKIVGRVRFALNRADLRSKYYEKLAVDLSTFAFWADLFHVRCVRGELTSEQSGSVGGLVNESYVALKTNEYVYRSWVRRYWSRAGTKNFEAIMHAAKDVYEAIIEFNEEGDEARKTTALGQYLNVFQSGLDNWLSKLDA